MAKSKINIITHRLSEKISDLLVFRQVDGKTIMSKIPRQIKQVSEKQATKRYKFQQAVIYTHAALESLNTGELYKAEAKKVNFLQTIMNENYFKNLNI
jgi:hypothetical protein